MTLKTIVTKSPLTLHNPMNSSPPGSSIHGILQARILENTSPGNFPDPGIQPGLLHCRQSLYCLWATKEDQPDYLVKSWCTHCSPNIQMHIPASTLLHWWFPSGELFSTYWSYYWIKNQVKFDFFHKTSRLRLQKRSLLKPLLCIAPHHTHHL